MTTLLPKSLISFYFKTISPAIKVLEFLVTFDLLKKKKQTNIVARLRASNVQ